MAMGGAMRRTELRACCTGARSSSMLGRPSQYSAAATVSSVASKCQLQPERRSGEGAQCGEASVLAQRDLVAQFRETGSHLPYRDKCERWIREAPREERLTLAQGHRADLNDEFIK